VSPLLEMSSLFIEILALSHCNDTLRGSVLLNTERFENAFSRNDRGPYPSGDGGTAGVAL